MPLLIIVSFFCLPQYSFSFPSQLFLRQPTRPMPLTTLFFNLAVLVELSVIPARAESPVLALSPCAAPQPLPVFGP